MSGGMFAKDKAIGLVLTEMVPQGEEFTLWGARVLDGTVPTRYGNAESAELEITRKGDREHMKVTTLGSAIVDKVKEAIPEDFPAVVMWTRVNTSAGQEQVLVLRFIRPLNAERTVAEEPTPPPVPGE